MLHLHDAEKAALVQDNKISDFAVITDVEAAFGDVVLKDDETTKNLLYNIDKAKYLNEFYFIDRFGAKVSVLNLSTGCKAALCVHYLEVKIIDLKECGFNARDAILAFCKKGNIIYV